MVFWCGGGLFSASDSVQREKVGEKATFYRVSEGTLESFWCDFVVCPSFPAMVFWCGGGLLSAPDSLTGRGWDRFFFKYSFRRDVREFFGAVSWLVRTSLP